MKVTYTYNFGDHANFIWQHQMRSPIYILLNGITAVAVVWIACWQNLQQYGTVVAVISFAVVSAPVFVVLLILNFLLSVVMSISKKNKTIFTEGTVELREDSIIAENKFARSEYKWEIIQKVFRTRKYIYIYVAQLKAIVIPKRSFQTPQEWEEFYQYVGSHSRF